jgi:uncharacterized protein YozE (UPF0346 family)
MSAFGYEQEDGSVHVILCQKYSFDEIYPFLLSHTVPTKMDSVRYISAEAYFSEENFTKDSTNWRILYKLDNTAVIRATSSGKTELVFHPICRH